MKVLITGATGLVGKALTAQLLERGDEVNYLTTSESKVENQKNINGFVWDPKRQEIDKTCFEGVDYIINLAGASVAERWTSEHKKAILDSRIDSLNLLYQSLSEIDHKVKHLISASAIGVYPSSLTKLYDEAETELSNDFLGHVVQEWEKASSQFENLNINVAQLRIGVVLSGDGGALEQMAKPIKNYVGATLGSGQQWQSWIHIKDLASMFCHVMDEELTGVYNAVAPNPVNNKKLTQAIAKILDKPILLPPVPKFALKLLLGEMAQIVLGSQLVSADKIQDHGFVFEFVHVEQALEDIYNKKAVKN
ncbi:TIGR01777 family oxidoreductase [Flavobacteriaceae bacterium 14752]|uniref:TIGR01777 family oxidoreductase n=1 Tax=Mesohalobacter salilacus TaxID=2491711 RepID=UPI000F640E57|nr:TIGR01777 family protein [Flavobacteriaceae bacterium 14752]